MADEILSPLFGHSSASERRKVLDQKQRRAWIISVLCVIVVVIAVVIGLVIWIATVLVHKLNPADQSLHQHAANAATVMGNQPAGASGIDLARSVVGTGTDDIITVLNASGTRRHGDVLLRIAVTVEPTSEFDWTDRAVGCFDYAFDYTASPDEVSCPDEPPLKLPSSGPSTTTTVS